MLPGVSFEPSFFREAPHKPRLALSLRLLARAVDQRWPTRGTASDGWLGDAAHAARKSDHNPDDHGIVRALDVTRRGIDPRQLITACLNHPSTSYVIFDHTIWSREHDFEPRPYHGTDAHLTHVHVSIRPGDTASASRQGWHFA